MYHYSTKTGKAEKCNAINQDSCPFGNFFHYEDIAIVQEYADNENENNIMCKHNAEKMFNTSWEISEAPAMVLSTYSKRRQNRISYNVIKDYVPYIDDELNNKICDFVVLPKTKDAVQKFLEHQENAERMIDLINDDIRNIKRTKLEYMQSQESSPYDKWELIDIIKYAGDEKKNILNAKIEIDGPGGHKEYSFSNVWHDFLSCKSDNVEIYSCDIKEQDYYVIKLARRAGDYRGYS